MATIETVKTEVIHTLKLNDKELSAVYNAMSVSDPERFESTEQHQTAKTVDRLIKDALNF